MISTIGGGPAGSFYASKVKDEDVTIFEEHKEIGNPVACTGILTDAVKQFVRIPKELVISKIKKFKLIAPNGQSIYIDNKKTNYILDRAGFDRYVSQLAVDNGTKVNLGERFIGYKKIKNGMYQVKTSKKTYDTSMIVGADGPKSSVAKAAGIYGERRFVMGYQARCRYPDLEEGVTVVHLDCGEFSWIVPEDNNIARVGVIGVNGKKLREDYKRLLGNSKIIEDQSGLIPLYNPRQKLKAPREEVYLLGDAATHVKATTYGGIIYGMIAGNYLADDKSRFIKNVNKKLSKDLWISLKMRDMMNSMTDKQADEMIDIFQKKSNNKILSESDRNFPSKFVVQLLMKEAKLWKLGFGIFKNKMTGDMFSK
ncbi:NAD(P)/FAD-dependent oxidoreductase [Candidatus Woesearchaeota archaeon]|nr:NAD(P)/FAD-dependent oxidoreductase [Candidatus Woesearchaeota archaeon]